MHRGKRQKRTRASPEGPFLRVASIALLSVGLAGGVAFSCTRPARQPASSVQVTDPADPIVRPAKTKKVRQEHQQPATYADAIRMRRFDWAKKLLDRESESELSQPELRYARALVALELGEFETALRQVEDLEVAFPQFEREATQIRLRAAQVSQDVTLLSHFLAGSSNPEDLLQLAEAHMRSSSLLEARKLADQTLGLLPTSKRRDHLELSARAHEIRAESLIAEDKKREAAKEYHWLATHAASLDTAADSDESMAKLDPGSRLTAQERLSRAKTFSEAGWVERTQDELSKLKGEDGTITENEDALLAWAVYVSRTDYKRASELFAKAAARSGEDRQKHLYYEAKALARSHHDADAIEKYDLVARMKGPYADHAAYQSARLRFIDGQWKEAVTGYQSYMKRFGGAAKHRQSASYDLPIARLAAGDYEPAILEIRKLILSEPTTRGRARLMELEGVALLGAGRRSEAIETFAKVIDYRPLSMPALLAAARLRALGEKPPPAIVPPPQDQNQKLPPLSLSLPDKVYRLQKVGLDEEAEQAMREEESRIRSETRERWGEALCKLYTQLQSAKRQYQVAQSAASWNVLRFAPALHTEWQWDCIYPEPYRGIVQGASDSYEVPSAFIYAVMRQESAFRPEVVSPAQAVGLMQIIPPTATRIAQELRATYTPELMRAPAVNVRFGAYYLRRLLDMFGNRMELAAAAYNAGPHAVTRWLRRGEDLPLDVFIARIPYTETRNYVYRVLGNYARYAYRSDERGAPLLDLDLPKGLRASDDAY